MSLARRIRKLAAWQLTLVAAASVMFYLWNGVLPAASAGFGGLIAMANVVLLLWRRERAWCGWMRRR